MSTDTVLLIIIAVCAVFATLGVVIAVAVLLRTIAGLDQTRARADRILSEVERETGPTIKEIQGTARGVTDLSWVLKRLAEEAVLGLVGRRVRQTSVKARPAPSQSSVNLSAVHAGIDAAFRLVELWRNLRGARRAKEASVPEDE